MQVDLQSTLRRSEGLLHAPAGPDAAVMMHVEAGNYYGLNAVGARIWELLETPCTVADLSARLQTEFDVAPEVCTAEVIAFAQSLAAQGIVDVDPA